MFNGKTHKNSLLTAVILLLTDDYCLKRSASIGFLPMVKKRLITIGVQGPASPVEAAIQQAINRLQQAINSDSDSDSDSNNDSDSDNNRHSDSATPTAPHNRCILYYTQRASGPCFFCLAAAMARGRDGERRGGAGSSALLKQVEQPASSAAGSSSSAAGSTTLPPWHIRLTEAYFV